MRRMYMQDLISRLWEEEEIRTTPASVRHAEMMGHIPAATRDWRGFRTFDQSHVKGLAAWLGKRREKQTA